MEINVVPYTIYYCQVVGGFGALEIVKVNVKNYTIICHYEATLQGLLMHEKKIDSLDFKLSKPELKNSYQSLGSMFCFG